MEGEKKKKKKKKEATIIQPTTTNRKRWMASLKPFKPGNKRVAKEEEETSLF